MSENQRQQQLAAARKQLGQYHERNSLTGPAGANNIQPQIHRASETNPVDKPLEEALQYHNAPVMADQSPFPQSVPSPHPVTINTASVEDHDADLGLNSMAGLENLKQLSEKLMSFVSDTTLQDDRENLPCSEMMEDLEELYEGLAEALDTCCKSNLQLTKKVKLLDKKHKDSLNQLHQQKANQQNLLQENNELRKHLQIHKQTIQILEAEKNHLHIDLAQLQQVVADKSWEMQSLTNSLQSSQMRVAELEAVLSSMTTQQEEEKEHSRELRRQTDSLQQELRKTNKTIQELQEYNSTLEERLQATREHGMEELQKELATSTVLPLKCSGPLAHQVNPQDLPQAIEDKAQLETQVGSLKEELENMARQLQAQLDLNKTLSQQKLQQEEQLLALELASKMCNEQAVARLDQLLETLTHNQSTIRHALGENQHLRNQLAQLQDGLGKLSSHNTQLTSTLQGEQHTKKQLAKQLEQLQQEVLQGRREIQLVNQNLQQTQEQLTATMQQNQQLQAQVSLLAVPAGSEIEGTKDDEAARLTLTIPDNVESREDIIAFVAQAQTSAEAERARLGHQLRQQKLRCQCLAQLAALNHTRPEQEALAPHSGGDSISQEIQGIMQKIENLARFFKEDLRVKTFVKEQVEDLELLFMQLRGEVDSIPDHAAFYGRHLKALEKQQREKEQYIAQLDRDTQQMALELQDLLLQLEQGKSQAASQSPPGKPTSGPTGPQEAASACADDFEDIDINEDEDTAAGGTREASLLEKPSVQRIVPVLPDFEQMRKEEEAAAGLGSQFIPFHYRPAKDDPLDIFVI
ncbi:golgin subfamily A member 2-like [Dipodomys spectabilis]|uniref:golgin subfamily A member 2-like n=1 Tax=Dipodomys spectabilis TaxID=105255 RepID=UPI001C5450C4|nr:golgin subfamily A member 2-like [Dipodomys spectabilis]